MVRYLMVFVTKLIQGCIRNTVQHSPKIFFDLHFMHYQHALKIHEHFWLLTGSIVSNIDSNTSRIASSVALQNFSPITFYPVVGMTLVGCPYCITWLLLIVTIFSGSLNVNPKKLIRYYDIKDIIPY